MTSFNGQEFSEYIETMISMEVQKKIADGTSIIEALDGQRSLEFKALVMSHKIVILEGMLNKLRKDVVTATTDAAKHRQSLIDLIGSGKPAFKKEDGVNKDEEVASRGDKA